MSAASCSTPYYPQARYVQLYFTIATIKCSNIEKSNKDLVVFQIQAANRILLRADAYCINDTTCPFHSQGKGSILEVSLIFNFYKITLLTIVSIQAFKSVINLADSGNITNITTDDVRFVTTLASSGNPKLSSINLALYGALNDDWSGFIQPDLGPGFTEAIAVVLPTLCQDQREAPPCRRYSDLAMLILQSSF